MSYVARKYREWRGALSLFGEAVRQFKDWSTMGGKERTVHILHTVLYFWNVVLPAVLIPVFVVLLAWVAMCYEPTT